MILVYWLRMAIPTKRLFKSNGEKVRSANSRVSSYSYWEEITTLRSEISRSKQKHPSMTSNAAAQLIAQKHGTSILRKLDTEYRLSLKGISLVKTESLISIGDKSTNSPKPQRNQQPPPIIIYHTDDFFAIEHIKELSKAFHFQCYTSVFILFRKIVENLIIKILINKFPSRHDLIYNDILHRYHDFAVVLENLFKEKSTFSHEEKKPLYD